MFLHHLSTLHPSSCLQDTVSGLTLAESASSSGYNHRYPLRRQVAQMTLKNYVMAVAHLVKLMGNSDDGMTGSLLAATWGLGPVKGR